MTWQIDLSDQVAAFLDTLTVDERTRVIGAISRLEHAGPNLPTPYAKLIVGSKHKNMKELRIDYGGSCFRILYAFDTSRKAFLLAAADKTTYGYERFYDDYIPIADELFDARIAALSAKKATAKSAKATKRGQRPKKGKKP